MFVALSLILCSFYCFGMEEEPNTSYVNRPYSTRKKHRSDIPQHPRNSNEKSHYYKKIRSQRSLSVEVLIKNNVPTFKKSETNSSESTQSPSAMRCIPKAMYTHIETHGSEKTSPFATPPRKSTPTILSPRQRTNNKKNHIRQLLQEFIDSYEEKSNELEKECQKYNSDFKHYSDQTIIQIKRDMRALIKTYQNDTYIPNLSYKKITETGINSYVTTLFENDKYVESLPHWHPTVEFR